MTFADNPSTRVRLLVIALIIIVIVPFVIWVGMYVIPWEPAEIELPYLVKHFEEYNGRRVRTTGVVKYYDIVRLYADFMLEKDDARIPVRISKYLRSSIKEPILEGSTVNVEGIVSWYDWGANGFYYIHAEAIMILLEIPKRLLQLEATLQASKLMLSINESVTFTATIRNIGKDNITLFHGSPLFSLEVYDERGKLVDRFPLRLLNILIIRHLKPGDSYSEHFEYAFGKAGTYKVIAYAEFYLEDPTPRIDTTKLYSDPILVRVKPGTLYSDPILVRVKSWNSMEKELRLDPEIFVPVDGPS